MFHYKNKNIFVYTKDLENETADIYDGCEYSKMTIEELNNILKLPYNYDFILVKSNSDNLQEFYKSYTKDVRELYDETNGLINLYRCNYYVDEGVRVFRSLQNIDIEEIKDFEIPYISNCGGGVRIAEQYKGPAYKYDKRSFYPFIMGTKVGCPVKQGTLKEISKEMFDKHTNLGCGIYNCKIYATSPKLFTELKTNMYTHHEVNWAKKLNLKIELLDTTYLSYEGKLCISFSKLFSKYFKILYPLKLKKNKVAKLMLNSLWGKLVSNNVGNYTITVSDLQLKESDEIIDIVPSRNGTYRFKVMNRNKKHFKYDYARLKPFLLGYGRVYMHRQVQYHGVENIVFSHTDSIISKVELNATNKRLEKVEKIGSWKYEGYSNNCIIHNKNQYEF